MYREWNWEGMVWHATHWKYRNGRFWVWISAESHTVSLSKTLNPLNPGHFYEFCKFIKISPVGITKWNHFIQEEFHLNWWQNIQVYSPKTQILSINSTLIRENGKWQNGGQIPFPVANNPTLFGQKQLGLEGNIEQTASNKVTVWNTANVPR
jgi:hypothetical protein